MPSGFRRASCCRSTNRSPKPDLVLEHFRLVWRRASALRFRSPKGLRHYSHIETASSVGIAPIQRRGFPTRNEGSPTPFGCETHAASSRASV